MMVCPDFPERKAIGERQEGRDRREPQERMA